MSNSLILQNIHEHIRIVLDMYVDFMRPFPEGGRIKWNTWFFFFLGGDFEIYE